MSLHYEITQNRKVILERCFNLITDTYPSETAQFLKQEKDRFKNPVGYNIKNGIETIFEELTGEMDSNKLNAALENIIKIMAVQDFSPSEAVGFVFLLKKTVIETTMGGEYRYKKVRDINSNESIGEQRSRFKENESAIFEELFEIEQRIDRIALLAFDIYMQCRDKINEIKSKGLNTKVNYGK